MFITKMALSRRTFLRGVGAAVALPWLDSMVPAFSTKAYAATASRRFGAIYTPHGFAMEAAPHSWTPEAAGSNFPMTPILRPVERHRDVMTIVSGLNGDPHDGGHSQCPVTYLSGALPKRTEGRDIYAGTTVDQVIAAEIGQETVLPSLEVATEDFTGYIGACTTGYSCAYANTISWSSPTTPLPMEINPRVVFERLFGEPGNAAQRAARIRRDRSILDFVTEETERLRRGLGARDVARLDQYLNNVREIERRIERTEAHNRNRVLPTDAPIGVPESFEEHVGLLYDLLAVAYEAELTRVFTYMVARELSARTYPQAGVPEQHHQVSHHGNDPDKIAKVAKINTYHSQLFATFLEKLRGTPDGDGSLLDHSLIVYGGGMGNPNVHAAGPLPMVAVGGGAGRGNRHLQAAAETPVGNLWLGLAHRYGSSMERFGVSSGSLEL